jgi:cell division protein FtsN
MFCTHCEFEIKGDDRKECPVCGGPLIDYAEVKNSSQEIPGTGESDQWEETGNVPKEKTPFDFGKALETDNEHPLQEPEGYLPLSSLGEPEPQSEASGGERSAEDAACTDLNESTGESDRWEETRNTPTEKTPFDFGSTLKTDDEHPLQEPEEPTPLFSQSETELEPEAADTPRSTEEVVPDIPDSYDTLPEEIIAAAQQTELNATHASRKQLAISILGVLALVAAITTIAIFKPQQIVYPDMGHLKTKTEKTVGKILSIITQKEEKKVVAQKPSVQSNRFQQRQKKHAAGNVDPDKKRSRLEELSPGGKGKGTTGKEHLKTPHRKPLAKQATDHAIIASLQETSPLLVEKDLQSLAVKRSIKNPLERETAPVIPVLKKTSHSSLYSIQAGSFKSKEVAAGEIDRLKKMGFHAYIQTVDLKNGETWHRIKVGSYSNREEAENTQNELRQKVSKLKSYIMRRVTEPQKTAPPLKKTPTPEVEPPITEMKAASYLTLPSGEAPQVVSDGGEALPLLKENFVPEIERLITEMKAAPSLTPPSEEAPRSVSEGGEPLLLLK